MYTLENPNLVINESLINDLLNECKDKTIVAATKYITDSQMKDLLAIGINNFGENRVDSFIKKHFILRNENITWHFIGHLQRNKAKLVINDIDYLHSLDSLELCKLIEKYRDKPLNCFVEIKLSSSITKNGVLPSDLHEFLLEAKKYSKVNIIGLMAMTEYDMTDEEKYNLFKEVVKYGEKYNLSYFSMGMSGDYKLALKAGATHLRLGSILYR
ncbi:MAG: YggS family pyridoxal phosphate-dependent enzyme [Anaeroplasmataceae bacterium]